jgi:tight adherence protein B
VRIGAALAAGIFAYFAVGYLTGNAPELRIGSVRARRGQVNARQHWLLQAGLRMTPVRFWAGSAVLGFAVFAVVLMITGSAVVASVPGLLMALLPRAFYARRRRERLREVQDAWPDGIHDLIAGISAGKSLVQALGDLARRGPEPLREAFARFPFLAQALGAGPSLEVVREELADPTSDRVIEVLILAKKQGGPVLIEILRDLAKATAEDVKALEEIRTAQLEQKINAWAVSAMPWFVLVILTARPGHFREFYQSAAGGLVIVIGGLFTLLGLWTLMRLGREPIEERVLGGAAPPRDGRGS